MSSVKTSFNQDSSNTRNAHRTSLLQNLERRIESAKQQGNDVLLRQLEDERHQLAL